jgi:nitroreductase
MGQDFLAFILPSRLRARGLMDFQELVHSRRSVRGFRNVAVPKAVIREIIEDAKRAPSSMNSQPWHVHVLTGEPLEQVRRRNMEEMAAGKPSKRDIFTHGPTRAPVT